MDTNTNNKQTKKYKFTKKTEDTKKQKHATKTKYTNKKNQQKKKKKFTKNNKQKKPPNGTLPHMHHIIVLHFCIFHALSTGSSVMSYRACSSHGRLLYHPGSKHVHNFRWRSARYFMVRTFQVGILRFLHPNAPPLTLL